MGRTAGYELGMVVLVTAFIAFFNLGGIPLLDPDEPVYAQTAREMLQFNDFISPRIYGENWYDKPPMYYWLTAFSFKLFGVSEFTARLPSALLAVMGTAAVCSFGAKLFNARVGLLSALVLATSIEYFYLAKAAVTDITLTFCLSVALLAFLSRRYWLFYIFTALAVVTKGPVGFLFPGAIIFLYLTLAKRWPEIKEMKIPAGLLLFAVIALPWYVVMYNLHGEPFIDTFLGFHNITRFTSPEHPEGILWYYFIPVLILGFFPWTAVLAQSVWSALHKSKGREYSQLLFLVIWAAFIFIFFSVSQTKLVSYILPMFPPLALLVGWYLDRNWDSVRQNRLWAILTAALSTAFVYGLWLGSKDMLVLQNGALLTGILLAILALAALYYGWQRQATGRFFILQTAVMILFASLLVTVLLPPVAADFSVRELASEFEMKYNDGAPVYVLKFLHPGFTFYSGVNGRELKGKESLLAVLAFTNNKAYFLIRRSEYEYLSAAAKSQLQLLSSQRDKLLFLRPATAVATEVTQAGP